MGMDKNIRYRPRYVVNTKDDRIGNEPLVHLTKNYPTSLLEEVMLAFQHTIVTIGTTVMICRSIIPQMGGDNGDEARSIQTLLFTAGINTLLQTLLGSRLPTIMVASSTFVTPVMLIIQDFSNKFFASEHQRFVHTMRSIQGALIVSSFFNIIIGYSFAWAKIAKYFTPISIVSIVCLGGLGNFQSGFPQVGQCMEIGLPMLLILVFFQQYLKAFTGRWSVVFVKFGVLISISIVWAFAALLTVSGAYRNSSEQTKMNCTIDSSNLVSSSPWVKIPLPFHWGTPIFKASHVFAMMVAALASASESTGMHYPTARLSGENPPPVNTLSRSVGMQGFGMLIDGIFGAAVGTTASVENAGLIGLTHVGSRKVVLMSSGFMIFFSIFGKFGAIFSSIPLPIFAAMTCVLSGNISATGISYTQFTDSNQPRNLYAIGLSLFLGLSIPQYFKNSTSFGRGSIRTTGAWVNGFLGIIFSSATVVAMSAGTVIDNTLDTEGMDEARGLKWWIPYQKDGDEYYSLPRVFGYGGGDSSDSDNDSSNNGGGGGGGGGNDGGGSGNGGDGGGGGDNSGDGGGGSGGGGSVIDVIGGDGNVNGGDDNDDNCGDVGGVGGSNCGGGGVVVVVGGGDCSGGVVVVDNDCGGVSGATCNCNRYGNCNCNGNCSCDGNCNCNCNGGGNCNCEGNYNGNTFGDSNNWPRCATIVVTDSPNNNLPYLPRDPCVIM